jgi:hypothetical protein
MGLKSVFQNAAAAIITGFDDIATSGIAYHSLGTFSYVAATGVQTESGATNTTIKVIYDEIKSQEIQDRDIKMTDRKLLVANNDISVTPKVGDYVTIASIKYNIVDFETDPAIALYTLFARRS